MSASIEPSTTRVATTFIKRSCRPVTPAKMFPAHGHLEFADHLRVLADLPAGQSKGRAALRVGQRQFLTVYP